MSLVTTTLFIAVAIVKFGIPNSIVRFYAEYKAADKLPLFFSTLFLGISGFAILAGVCFILAIQACKGLFHDENLTILLTIAALLVVTSCLSDVLMSFLRAEQRTKLYNVFAIVRRYVTLASGIAFALYLIKGVKGFFLGQLLTGTSILVVLLFVFRNNLELRRENVSKEIFTTSLRFGFPLVWAEFGHLLLNYVDRYLIQFYLGAAALGMYTAGYNLATHITEVLICPLNYAMTPIYMSILVKKGKKETKEFFTNIFTYFLMILLPVIFGSIAVGRDLISLLASTKYLEAYRILSYIIVGQAVYACTIILNNGLFINKKTYIYNNIMIITSIINIILNMILIPHSGITGAAQATLLSYIIFAVIITFYSFKEFSFRIDFHRILLYAGSSLLMFFAVKSTIVGSSLLNILVQVVVGIVVYITAVVLLDGEIRRTLLTAIANANNRRA
jgi:O-antigen/teichoic acid export membrane protein